MIKNVVFDMGGVIVEVHREEAIRQFQSIGVADADLLIHANNHKGLFLAFEDGKIDSETFRQQLSAHAGKEISMEAVEGAWRSIISKPPQYKLDYILELRKSFKTYLLTNNNPILIRWARTNDFSDAGFPITHYFDKLYISYEMKCTKPGRLIFEKMIADSGILPSETLFIEDGILNIQTAKELGFQIFQAVNGEDWRDALTETLYAQFHPRFETKLT
ncbi:MAG: HAD family phosphatase [Tannerella sp.]|jgi:putative hydrolase of the HAD superfamily|nr:HAD family phosphatase [Tannerella sp.]